EVPAGISEVPAGISEVPAGISEVPAGISAEIPAGESPEEAELVEELEEAETAEELTEEAKPEAIEEAIPVDETQPPEVLTDETQPAEVLEELEEAESAPANEEAVTITEPETDIPMIDISEMNISASQADEAVRAMGGAVEEEIEELEELEEAEEAEELEEEPEVLEEIEETPGSGFYDDLQSGNAELDEANLASQIEFSPFPELENQNDDEILSEDLEIVSPFSTMLSDFADADYNNDIAFQDMEEGRELPYEAPVNPQPVAEPLEELPAEKFPAEEAQGSLETPPGAEAGSENQEILQSTGEGENGEKNETVNETENPVLDEAENVTVSLPIMFKPFHEVTDSTDIGTLEAISGAEEETAGIDTGGGDAGDAKVIEEREGVPYISTDVLQQKPDDNKNLNQDFKDLVDSVIK
ncbi:MAG: hypothetical protein FWF26_04685, partial [Treponema sp.]|nr:hypothetical protein [Treponema sp.]